MLTAKEYLDLWHRVGANKFFNEEWPRLVNAEWTIDGKAWFPCVALADETSEGHIRIVTRNQTHTTELRSMVRILG